MFYPKHRKKIIENASLFPKKYFLCTLQIRIVRDIMKRYFQDFIFYNRGQRLGILTLSLLVLIIFGIDLSYSSFRKRQTMAEDSLSSALNPSKELTDFLTGITSLKVPAATEKTQTITTAKRFPFNPNTADSAQLNQLGLPDWMIRNILKYRAKGGRFRQAEDFKKIYGMKEEFFASLLPYIKIPADSSAKLTKENLVTIQPLNTFNDTLRYPKTEKYSPGTTIELNQADTMELKKIPGIGSGIAHKIIAYREQLGGYYDIQQLEEINLNSRLLSSWFQIDTTQIKRIPVNQASVARLKRHPYINFYQAKALVDYRKKQGSIRNMKPFVLLEEFTRKDLERIPHYLDFSEPQ